MFYQYEFKIDLEINHMQSICSICHIIERKSEHVRRVVIIEKCLEISYSLKERKNLNILICKT